jgi:ABC-2 type transport system permease protein
VNGEAFAPPPARSGPPMTSNRDGVQTGPSLALRAFAAQARIELLLTTRRGENVLVTILVPLLFLVFFASVRLLPEPASGVRVVDALVPAILALSIISTGQVSLGIATAFERSYGVLKRLGGSPLPRWALLGAKTLAIVVTEIVQVLLVALVGGIMGWSPPGGIGPAVAAALPWLALGSVAFCAFGLLLAGTLRAEAVLAVANGLYLVFILLGGVIVPLDRLPGPIAAVAGVLPPALLTDLLRGVLQPGSSVSAIEAAGLAAWAIGLAAAAILTFRPD